MEDIRLYEICDITKNYYQKQLLQSKDYESQIARTYFNSRNINIEDARIFELGYAPKKSDLINILKDKGYTYDEMLSANVILKDDKTGQYRDRFYNRVMFPVYNNDLQVCGFGGRALNNNNSAKYINTSATQIFNKSEILYGFPLAVSPACEKSSLIVVEGYTDVIAMHKAGFNNTVATLGTALTDKHIKQINKLGIDKVVYMFDGDIAGQNAAMKASKYINEMYSTYTSYHSVTLPEGLDPAEYLNKYGIENMGEEISKSRDLIVNCMNSIYKNHDLAKIEEPSKAGIESLELLLPIRDTHPEVCEIYCEYLSDFTNMQVGRNMFTPQSFQRQLHLFKTPKKYYNFSKKDKITNSIQPIKSTTKTSFSKGAR